MRGSRVLVTIALSLAMFASGAQAQTPAAGGGGQILTFAEDIPCPPTAPGGAGAVASRRHVRHVRRHHARAPVHRVESPVRRTIRRVAVAHRVHRRRPIAAPAVLAAAPTRCTVLRRERLTAASFGVTPQNVELAPLADDVETVAPAIGPLSSGRPALPNIVNPTGGGGAQTSVNAAPEPSAWALMMMGVAMLGVGLRRRRSRPLVS